MIDVSAARSRSSAELTYLRFEPAILSTLSVVAVLAAWEYVVASGLVNPIFFSSPTRIVSAFLTLVESGVFWEHVGVSAVEFGIGLGLSVALGIPIGYLAALSKRANYLLEPALAALYATPTIALIPLIIIWFGIGIWDKVFVVFLSAFFQIAISTMGGIRLADARLVKVARSYGASRAYLFRSVLFPASIPFVLVGLRLGISRALVGVVVAEFVAASAGIGFLISYAGSRFQTSTVFVGIIFVALLGIAGTALVRSLERRVEAWRPKVGAA